MFALSARGKALENLYARDQEISFIIETRRNRLMGLWAAALLGKDDASAYAEDVVASAMDGKAEHQVFDRLRTDFQSAGVTMLDDTIYDRMRDMLQAAAKDMR